MGADLYIESLYNEHEKTYRPLFDIMVEARDKAKAAGQSQQVIDEIQTYVSMYYEKMFEVGYFRDSYNGTSLAAMCGFSWWADIVPMQNKQGNIGVRSLAKFRAFVEAHPIDTATITKARLKEASCTVDAEGENSLDGWRTYFINKHVALLNFIDLAIKHKQPIRASL